MEICSFASSYVPSSARRARRCVDRTANLNFQQVENLQGRAGVDLKISKFRDVEMADFEMLRWRISVISRAGVCSAGRGELVSVFKTGGSRRLGWGRVQ